MRFIPLFISSRIAGALFVALTLTTAPFSAIDAAAQLGLDVLSSESVVSIAGSSNVNEFICKAEEVDGAGQIESKKEVEPVAEVAIPVEAFDCRNGRMNRDFFEALKGSRHPYISYRLDGVRVLNDKLENGATLLEAEGTIWVAGVGRSIRTRVVGDRLANGNLRATGSLDLSMSEFNIEPPTAMLGLVRVRDEITVQFEITAEPDSNITNAPMGAAGSTSNLLGGARQ